jgi:hypothetical protein
MSAGYATAPEPAVEDDPLAPEQFVDKHDRIYTLDLNVAIGRRIKAAHGVDLLNAGDGKAFRQLADRDLFLDVLWMFVEPICEQHRIDRDAFEASLDGAAIAAAGDAMVAAIVGFSPPSLQEGMMGVVKAQDAAQREAMARLVTSIESGPMKAKIEANIDDLLSKAALSIEKGLQSESTSGPSATSSPLSSAPRRKPTRSAG